MNNIFKKVFLYILILMAIGQVTIAQTLHGDSLNYYLIHLHEKTIDNDLKRAVEKAQALLYRTYTLNDSLVISLINVEDMLTMEVEENLLLNFKPFNRQIVFSFGEKLVSLFQDLSPRNESPYYASALNNLGLLYCTLSQWQSSPELFEKAYNIRKKILNPEHPDYAGSLLSMAKVHMVKGSREKALEFARKALMLSKKKEGLKQYLNQAGCFYFLANQYKGLFQYDTAAQFYQEILLLRKKIHGENDHYALYLFHTADMLQYLWQFDKSFVLYKQALHLTKKTLGENSLQYAWCLDGVGSIHYDVAEYERAIPYYQQSLTIKEQLFGKDYADVALSLHQLAKTYQQMGDYANALPLFQRASSISKKALATGLEDFNYAFSLMHIASLYQAMGQYSKALQLLQSALAITEKSMGKENLYYARTLNSLAVLFENMHRYDTALACYKDVLKTRYKISGEANPEYAASLDNLARLYKTTGKYNTAIQLCKKGLEVRKKVYGDKSPAYAASLNTLGELYMQTGKYDFAALLLNTSLSIRKEILGDFHPDHIKSLNNAGLLNIALASYTNAAGFFAEAGNFELTHIQRSYTCLSEQEKINLINQEYLQFSYLPSLLYKNPVISPGVLQQVYVNEIILKGMVMNEQKTVLRNIRQSRDSLLLQQYDQWHFNKSFLGRQLILPLAKRLPYIDSLHDITNQLEQQLSRSSASFLDQQQNQRITTSVISNKLPKGEAAIEFIKFQLYTKKFTDSIIYAALLLLPGDSIPKFIPLCEEKKLRLLLHDSSVKQLYPASNSQYSITESNSLFNLVWKPLEKHLEGVNTINYAPTGLLHRIAYRALRYNSSQLLIDRYQLNQLISTHSIALAEPSVKPVSINLWGDIRYNFAADKLNYQTFPGTQSKENTVVNLPADTTRSSFNFYTHDSRGSRGSEFAELPGTKQEIKNINELLQTSGIRVEIASDSIATEEAFKALDGKSPGVLHIATHGFFLPVKNKFNRSAGANSFTVQENPMFRSGLALAGSNPTWKGEQAIPGREDGILTAYEIAQMDLSNTDLVVLSACNTALGDLAGNEGVIGLQRAFKVAGAKQLLVSLWNIPDGKTTELMTLFYKNWLEGQSTAKALSSAQRIVKEKYPSPYYWAGFVLIE